MNNIIIITGGSGGHITPAIALAEELIKRNYHITFLADQKFAQFDFSLPDGLKYYIIDSTSPFKKGLKNKLLFPYKALIGLIKSIQLIRQYNPKLVVSFGGYMSFPGLIACILLRKKYMIHEQNAILGKANKFFAKNAYIVATSFKKMYNLQENLREKLVFTGNLVRKEFIEMRNSAQEDFNESKDQRLNILIIGGSQGAKIFDEIMPKILSLVNRDLRSKINIIQQVREENINILQNQYQELGIKAELKNFFPHIYDLYKKSNLIIARAGASTIAEISALGKASILIPFPYAAENHQFLNAKALVYEGGAWCIEENNEMVKRISEIINKILEDFEYLKIKSESAGKNFNNAQIKLADIVESI